MTSVIPAAPIEAFPVVIAGPTGPTGPSGSALRVAPAVIDNLWGAIEKLEARVAALEELAHVR
jgi:hypothetical protein